VLSDFILLGSGNKCHAHIIPYPALSCQVSCAKQNNRRQILAIASRCSYRAKPKNRRFVASSRPIHLLLWAYQMPQGLCCG
jgi:hypothetical protein